MKYQRIHWIDMIKGICMMAILLFHTEVYYKGSEIINYNLYVCDALIIFFFISGYNFYKPDIFSETHSVRLDFFKNKIKRIIRKIILPYFIFTSIIAFPKAIAHGTSTDVTDILLKIISGNASWFVAALAIAEIMFSTVLYICKGKHSVLSISAAVTLCMSLYISTIETDLWWKFENACMAFTFLYLGFLFHEKENIFKRFNNIYYTLSFFIIFIMIKIYVGINETSLLMEPVVIDNIPVFIIDTFIAILLMINVAKQLPGNKIIEWTGAHSLVYYFLCGGVPFTISAIFNKIGFAYNGQYYRIIIAFVLVYAVTSFMTWFIYRYIPFITGK